MKTFVTCCLIFVVLVTFSGCESLEKADDVTFDAVIQIDWVVDENGDGTDVAYTHSEVVELASNSEVEKYESKIKNVKLNKITYTISDYNAAPHNNAVTFLTGVASFSPVGGAGPVGSGLYSASSSGINLQTTTNETEFEFNSFDEVAGVFKADRQIVMTTNGVLSQTPVSFKVVSKFYVTITANALD